MVVLCCAFFRSFALKHTHTHTHHHLMFNFITKASWDDDIKRAFVILRNPLHAIPSYFNEM